MMSARRPSPRHRGAVDRSIRADRGSGRRRVGHAHATRSGHLSECRRLDALTQWQRSSHPSVLLQDVWLRGSRRDGSGRHSSRPGRGEQAVCSSRRRRRASVAFDATGCRHVAWRTRTRTTASRWSGCTSTKGLVRLLRRDSCRVAPEDGDADTDDASHAPVSIQNERAWLLARDGESRARQPSSTVVDPTRCSPLLRRPPASERAATTTTVIAMSIARAVPPHRRPSSFSTRPPRRSSSSSASLRPSSPP